MKFNFNKLGLTLVGGLAYLLSNISVGHVYSMSMNPWYDLMPYIGADFKYWHISTDDEGSPFFRENYYGGAVNIGLVWCHMLGLEVGYESTDRRGRDIFAPAGTVFVGGALATGTLVATSAQLRGPYIDLNGYFPIYNCFDIIGSIGVGFIDPRVNVTVAGVDRAANGRNRAVLRAGAGLQFMFSEYLGIRSILRWENTSALRVDINNAAGVAVETRPFDDAFTATLGLFVTFC